MFFPATVTSRAGVSADSKASYLASPPAGGGLRPCRNSPNKHSNRPLGTGSDGKPVYLKDIWPTPEEIGAAIETHLSPDLFKKTYSNVFEGPAPWRTLNVPEGERYDWEPDSTYIRRPPFFDGFETHQAADSIDNARCLAILPDIHHNGPYFSRRQHSDQRTGGLVP